MDLWEAASNPQLRLDLVTSVIKAQHSQLIDSGAAQLVDLLTPDATSLRELLYVHDRVKKLETHLQTIPLLQRWLQACEEKTLLVEWVNAGICFSQCPPWIQDDLMGYFEGYSLEVLHRFLLDDPNLTPELAEDLLQRGVLTKDITYRLLLRFPFLVFEALDAFANVDLFRATCEAVAPYIQALAVDVDGIEALCAEVDVVKRYGPAPALWNGWGESFGAESKEQEEKEEKEDVDDSGPDESVQVFHLWSLLRDGYDSMALALVLVRWLPKWMECFYPVKDLMNPDPWISLAGGSFGDAGTHADPMCALFSLATDQSTSSYSVDHPLRAAFPWCYDAMVYLRRRYSTTYFEVLFQGQQWNLFQAATVTLTYRIEGVDQHELLTHVAHAIQNDIKIGGLGLFDPTLVVAMLTELAQPIKVADGEEARLSVPPYLPIVLNRFPKEQIPLGLVDSYIPMIVKEDWDRVRRVAMLSDLAKLVRVISPPTFVRICTYLAEQDRSAVEILNAWGVLAKHSDILWGVLDDVSVPTRVYILIMVISVSPELVELMPSSLWAPLYEIVSQPISTTSYEDDRINASLLLLRGWPMHRNIDYMTAAFEYPFPNSRTYKWLLGYMVTYADNELWTFISTSFTPEQRKLYFGSVT